MAASSPRKSSARPVAAEAIGALIPVDFDGVTYNVPPSNRWPYAALVAFEDGKVAGFLRSLLGEEEHAKFAATEPYIEDLDRFVTAIQEGLGISGN